jgi:hypothetical protein
MIIYIDKIYMSQGDYIKRKQISHKLVGDGTTLGIVKGNGLLDYASVLDAKDYISFKKYSLEGSINSSSLVLNDLSIPNKTTIFGMLLDVSNCPNFIVCNDTNTRLNRKPLKSFQQTCEPVMKAPGLSVPPIWDTANNKLKYKYSEPAFKDRNCNCVNGRDFEPCRICDKY